MESIGNMGGGAPRLREAGRRAIRNEAATGELIPMAQDGVVFQQMFEYPVRDFTAEVGFYAEVLGLTPIALTTDYALFTHPQYRYCLSFRADSDAPSQATTGLKLLFMTADIDAADTHLGESGFLPDREIRSGSPVQRVIHFATPNGVAVEIWEDPDPGAQERE